MDMFDVLCIICIRLASFLQLCRCKCTLQIISSYYLSVLGGWVPDMPSLKNGFALRILCKQPATIQEPTPTWFSAFQYLKQNHSEQWEEFTTIFHWPTFDINFNCDVPFYQQSIWKPHDRLQSKQWFINNHGVSIFFSSTPPPHPALSAWYWWSLIQCWWVISIFFSHIIGPKLLFLQLNF